MCLFGNSLYDFVKDPLKDLGIDINDTFVPSKWKKAFIDYDNIKNKSKYILVEIEGYDEYDAMDNAIGKVTHYTSLYSFFHHKETFVYEESCSLVKRKNDGKCFKIRMPMAQIVACRDERKWQASELYKKNIQKIGMEHNSYLRFEKSILLHDSALRSDHEENQFLNLFTAFEVLIPKATNSGKDRIVQISDILLPYLCHSHFLKLAESFGKDLYHWKSKLYNSVLAQIVEGSTEDEKMCAFISLAKYQTLRDQIFKAAHDDNHVLLQYRLYKLNKRMSNVADVKSTYNSFIMRMRWHIARLYRTRNLIVHAGAHPAYLDMLLENIHAFYDTFMRELIIDITEKGMLKLEYSYVLRQSRHDKYLSDLNALPNSTILDESNFDAVLGLN